MIPPLTLARASRIMTAAHEDDTHTRLLSLRVEQGFPRVRNEKFEKQRLYQIPTSLKPTVQRMLFHDIHFEDSLFGTA